MVDTAKEKNKPSELEKARRARDFKAQPDIIPGLGKPTDNFSIQGSPEAIEWMKNTPVTNLSATETTSKDRQESADFFNANGYDGNIFKGSKQYNYKDLKDLPEEFKASYRKSVATMYATYNCYKTVLGFIDLDFLGADQEKYQEKYNEAMNWPWEKLVAEGEEGASTLTNNIIWGGGMYFRQKNWNTEQKTAALFVTQFHEHCIKTTGERTWKAFVDGTLKDPTTYLSFGGTKILSAVGLKSLITTGVKKELTSEVLKVVAKEGAEEIVEKGVKEAVETGVEDGVKAGVKQATVGETAKEGAGFWAKTKSAWNSSFFGKVFSGEFKEAGKILIGREALKTGTENAAQSAAENSMSQDTKIDAGLKKSFDYGDLAKETATGFVFGQAFQGAFHLGVPAIGETFSNATRVTKNLGSNASTWGTKAWGDLGNWGSRALAKAQSYGFFTKSDNPLRWDDANVMGMNFGFIKPLGKAYTWASRQLSHGWDNLMEWNYNHSLYRFQEEGGTQLHAASMFGFGRNRRNNPNPPSPPVNPSTTTQADYGLGGNWLDKIFKRRMDIRTWHLNRIDNGARPWYDPAAEWKQKYWPEINTTYIRPIIRAVDDAFDLHLRGPLQRFVSDSSTNRERITRELKSIATRLKNGRIDAVQADIELTVIRRDIENQQLSHKASPLWQAIDDFSNSLNGVRAEASALSTNDLKTNSPEVDLRPKRVEALRQLPDGTRNLTTTLATEHTVNLQSLAQGIGEAGNTLNIPNQVRQSVADLDRIADDLIRTNDLNTAAIEIATYRRQVGNSDDPAIKQYVDALTDAEQRIRSLMNGINPHTANPSLVGQSIKSMLAGVSPSRNIDDSVNLAFANNIEALASRFSAEARALEIETTRIVNDTQTRITGLNPDGTPAHHEKIDALQRCMEEFYFNPHPRRKFLAPERGETLNLENMHMVIEAFPDRIRKEYKKPDGEVAWKFDYSVTEKDELAGYVVDLYEGGFEQQALRALRFAIYQMGAPGERPLPSDLAGQVAVVLEKRLKAQGKTADLSDPHLKYFLAATDKVVKSIPSSPDAGGERNWLRNYAKESEKWRFATEFRGPDPLSGWIRRKLYGKLVTDFKFEKKAFLTGGKYVTDDGRTRIAYAPFWFKKTEANTKWYDKYMRFGSYVFGSHAGTPVRLMRNYSLIGLGLHAIEEGIEALFGFETDADIGSRTAESALWGGLYVPYTVGYKLPKGIITGEWGGIVSGPPNMKFMRSGWMGDRGPDGGGVLSWMWEGGSDDNRGTNEPPPKKQEKPVINADEARKKLQEQYQKKKQEQENKSEERQQTQPSNTGGEHMIKKGTLPKGAQTFDYHGPSEKPATYNNTGSEGGGGIIDFFNPTKTKNENVNGFMGNVVDWGKSGLSSLFNWGAGMFKSAKQSPTGQILLSAGAGLIASMLAGPLAERFLPKIPMVGGLLKLAVSLLAGFGVFKMVAGSMQGSGDNMPAENPGNIYVTDPNRRPVADAGPSIPRVDGNQTHDYHEPAGGGFGFNGVRRQDHSGTTPELYGYVPTSRSGESGDGEGDAESQGGGGSSSGGGSKVDRKGNDDQNQILIGAIEEAPETIEEVYQDGDFLPIDEDGAVYAAQGTGGFVDPSALTRHQDGINMPFASVAGSGAHLPAELAPSERSIRVDMTGHNKAENARVVELDPRREERSPSVSPAVQEMRENAMSISYVNLDDMQSRREIQPGMGMRA